MSTPTLILGNNKWAIEEDSILGYAVEDRNGSYLPREISFTRGSDATFTTSTGVIRQACWNLIGYSEEFDNAYWTKSNSSITTNAATAPNGTLTADTLNINVFTYSGLYRGISGNSSNYTISVYAKKNTKNWLYFVDIQGTAARAWFDLNNGVLGTVSSGYTATITDVGNGWYRCTLYNNSAQTPSYYQLGVSDSNNTTTPSTSGNIFIWGAQLVQGSDALGYLRTTDRLNMPRVDSSTGTKAFLLEPQRTNLGTWSDAFDNAVWTKTNVTVTANSTTSPDGSTNADTFTADGTSSLKNILSSVALLTAGVTYTTSVYAKKNTNNFLQIILTANAYSVGSFANYDLNSGVVGSTGGSGVVASIQSVGNGWYRCSVTATAIATSSANSIIYGLITSATSARGEVNTLSTSVYLFGAQLEAGAYPTTYIPTQATTVTRIADTATATNVGGLIGQAEGTIFWDIKDVTGTPTSTGNPDFGIRNTAFTNWIGVTTNGFASPFRVVVRTTSSSIIDYAENVTRAKAAVGWSSSGAVLYVNGSQVATSAVNPNFSFDRVDILGGIISYKANQFSLYTTRLTNAELAALTTL